MPDVYCIIGRVVVWGGGVVLALLAVGLAVGAIVAGIQRSNLDAAKQRRQGGGQK